jgi:hypothetical protein
MEELPDLSSTKVMVGLSGGINSMSALVYLAEEYPQARRPRELYLYYAHLAEHSPGTWEFVQAGLGYAESHFDQVTAKVVDMGSVVDYFDRRGFIPHPMLSPCSERLKFGPMQKWAAELGVELDIVGYIRTERRRMTLQQKRGVKDKFYAISHLSEEDCFALVDRSIGWHPAIYDIYEDGKRVFKHNNCLPCKNMLGALNGCGGTRDFLYVQKYYPANYERARALAEKVHGYWGRESDFDGYCKLCED